MTAIMEQLKADHGNISHLLATLDEQMVAVHDEGNADFELMHDIMMYMTHYPDHTHHPMEDLVFQKLTSRDSSADGVVTQLKREHTALAEKGERFTEMLRHVVDGAMVERKDLENTGRDYIFFSQKPHGGRGQRCVPEGRAGSLRQRLGRYRIQHRGAHRSGIRAGGCR